MSYLKIAIFTCFVLLFSGCFSSPFVPSSPTDARINNSKSVQKATMRPYTINGKTYYPTVVSVGDTASGIASWYGPNFHGKKTSNGEIYNMHNMTAAHKTLPMNTIVKVTNLKNSRQVIVRINDRGPFVGDRVIDLSKAAATQIDMLSTGTAPVKMEIVGFENNAVASASGYKTQDFKTAKSSQIYENQSVVGGEFMVQIGAFKNIEGANRYKNEHQNVMGYKSVVKTFSIDGDTFHRVFLTGFRSEEEARDFAKSGHFSGAYIVRG